MCEFEWMDGGLADWVLDGWLDGSGWVPVLVYVSVSFFV